MCVRRRERERTKRISRSFTVFAVKPIQQSTKPVKIKRKYAKQRMMR
jgi:hypothetical protein